MDPIRFSVSKDKDDNLIVCWTSKGRDLNFQKSGDFGKSWTEPVAVSRGGIHNSEYSAFAITDSVICAFGIFSGSTYKYVNDGPNHYPIETEFGGVVARISYDGGRSWGEEQRVLSTDKQLGGGKPASLSVISQGDTIYMIFDLLNRGIPEMSGAYFTKSFDYGQNWEKPHRLKIPRSSAKESPQYSLAINRGAVHMVYMAGDEICYVRGKDMGGEWDPLVHVDYQRAPKPVPSSGADYVVASTPIPAGPRIIASGGNLVIAYMQFYLFYRESQDNGESWGFAEAVSNSQVLDFSLCADGARGVTLAWADLTHQHKWWAHIPFNEVIFYLTNLDPYSENSDMLCMRVVDGKEGPVERLTPPHSFALYSDCISVGDSTYVFWSGKETIGAHVEATAAPYEIFVKNVSR